MVATTMQDVALEHQIAEAEEAQAELTRLQTMADSLPILKEQLERNELDRRAKVQLDSALARVTDVLEAEGAMLGHLRAQIAKMTADLVEVIGAMSTTQGRIHDAANNLGRAVHASVGVKHRSRLSDKDRAARAHAMADLSADLQKTWEILWAQAGGLSPDLLAFPPGTSRDRLSHDLMALVIKHLGRQPYHPRHSDDASPFNRKVW